jgi:hypothetical protein
MSAPLSASCAPTVPAVSRKATDCSFSTSHSHKKCLKADVLAWLAPCGNAWGVLNLHRDKESAAKTVHFIFPERIFESSSSDSQQEEMRTLRFNQHRRKINKRQGSKRSKAPNQIWQSWCVVRKEICKESDRLRHRRQIQIVVSELTREGRGYYDN